MSDKKREEKEGDYANMGAEVHARAAGWIGKQKRDRQRMGECERDGI